MALRSSLAQLRRWVGLVFAVVPILFAANGAHNQFEVNRVHNKSSAHPNQVHNQGVSCRRRVCDCR